MAISLEEFSAAIEAIHAAAAFPERWAEAFSAVSRLLTRSAGIAGRMAGDGDATNEIRERFEEFDPSAKRVMSLLVPHLKAAKQVQTRLAEATPGGLALAGLDHLAIATLIVDVQSTIQYTNACARALLACDRCLRVQGSRLRFVHPAWNSAFDVAVRRATRMPARPSLLPLSPGPCKRPYEVAVSPLHGGAPAAGASLERLALVVIESPPEDAKHIAQRIRQRYGLTQAEARVMAALALGATVEQVALAHGVHVCTVRAQVRSLFDKTGVHRQSDLVRLALAGAPLLARHAH